MAQKAISPAAFRALKPLLQAYIFAYLSTSSPRILGSIWSALRGKASLEKTLARCRNALRREAQADKLPAAFAVLVGGATLLPRLFNELITRSRVSARLGHRFNAYRDSVIKFVTAFGSAWVCFQLLNLRPSRPIAFDAASSDVRLRTHTEDPPYARGKGRRRRSSVALKSDDYLVPTSIPPLAGKTMDLTTFAIVRALGIVIYSAWQRRKKMPQKLEQSVDTLTPSMVFSMSSFVIMWNWFYSPDRLPQNYCDWISSAAQIDYRLIEALRQCRFGTFIYGKETGMGPLLGSLAQELGYPEVWGDPAKSAPIPCELYHSGTGSSCEWHAIKRFLSSWTFSMKMYLPINILVLSRRQPSARSFTRAFTEASRSSAFLAGFVSLFYYGVCCARTRVGPKLFSKDVYTPQMCDGGICVGTGCMACGWSILLEKQTRRSEVAFFVAPRALATVLPRRYDRKYIRREQVAFSLSTAVVLTAAQADPAAVQGVFGRLLTQIFT